MDIDCMTTRWHLWRTWWLLVVHRWNLSIFLLTFPPYTQSASDSIENGKIMLFALSNSIYKIGICLTFCNRNFHFQSNIKLNNRKCEQKKVRWIGLRFNLEIVGKYHYQKFDKITSVKWDAKETIKVNSQFLILLYWRQMQNEPEIILPALSKNIN
jgi:hypothetical protein